MSILNQPQIAGKLSSLHAQATAQHRNGTSPRTPQDAAQAFMAISPEQGNFLYFVASLTGAKNIVEFGCSFGISTTYLAAAARNTNGKVTTTEMEPNKVIVARANLADAGLGDLVEVLEGDAMQTLATTSGAIDLLFLDGEKTLYLPVFELLRERLKPGAVIVADNIDKAATHDLVNLIVNDPEHYNAVKLFDNRALVAYVI